MKKTGQMVVVVVDKEAFLKNLILYTNKVSEFSVFR